MVPARMLRLALAITALMQHVASWRGWRPGAQPFDFREDEFAVKGDAERHAACGFLVLDAENPHFRQHWLENADKPALIINLLKNWTAFEHWTLEWFQRIAHELRGDVNHERWFISPWNISDEDNPMCENCSWSARWSRSKSTLVEKYFELWNSKDDISNVFSEPNALIFDPGFRCDDLVLEPVAQLPEVFKEFCNHRHIAFNAFGTGHGLHRHHAAWQAQVVGNKSWYLMPPRIGDYVWDARSSSSHFGFPHEEQPRLTNTMCGYQPVRHHYRNNIQFCVQSPGEVVYVPDFWWHSTCALDDFNVATGGQLNVTISKNDVLDYAGGRISGVAAGLDGLTPARRYRSPEHGTMTDKREPLELLRSVERRLGPFGPHPGVDLVFEAIDGYCWEEQWMFILGDVKGAIVEEVVAEWSAQQAPGPMKAVEFGSFVGYSAMRIAKHLPSGSQLICVEPEYASADLKHTVDRLLRLALLDDVVRFQSEDNYGAMREFGNERVAFDIVVTDHIKEDYLPTLKQMTSQGHLRSGGLFLADNVVVFGIIDLLKYLRFSGDFIDYRLYYTELEYDDYHGQPTPSGDLWPDGVVVATYVGPGLGQNFPSPDAEACSRFYGCAVCLANLCGWCVDLGVCVPDVEGGTHACGAGGPLLGIFEGDIMCRGSELRPKSWVGPTDSLGAPRQGQIPFNPDAETCSSKNLDDQRRAALS